MSKLLSELLDADEPLFSLSIQKLEKSSGQQSVDVYLTAEIIAKAHQKMRELGLDPKFTNGRELYHALFGLVKLHDAFLAKKLGIKDHGNVHQALTAIKAEAKNLPVNQSVWAIKASVMKRMLKSQPPKKVMKILHYRSIESMLKRENACELLGGARFAESDEWHMKFLKQYENLKPADFEQRNIDVIYFDPKKWSGIANDFVRTNKHTVGHLKEMGAIILAPLPVEHLPGITITTLPFVLHYMNEIRLYSTYFKSQQVKTDFGNIVYKTIAFDPDNHAEMAGHGIHWRVIQRRYGNTDIVENNIFEPHLSRDDLAWHSAERALYKIEPALHFWYEMDYVGAVYDGSSVSFNLLDMAVSVVNNLTYGYHAKHQMQSSLWHEMYARYLTRPSLEHQALKHVSVVSDMTEFNEFSTGVF